MTDAPDVESKAAFSRRLGVSKAWVSQLIAKGLPLTADGKSVQVAAALSWVRNNIKTNAPDGDGSSLAEARTRLILAQAALAEINLSRERGVTIDREEAKRAVRALMRMHRDTVLNFANRHGPQLAADLGIDPRKLIGALEAKLRVALIDGGSKRLPFGMAEESQK